MGLEASQRVLDVVVHQQEIAQDELIVGVALDQELEALLDLRERAEVHVEPLLLRLRQTAPREQALGLLDLARDRASDLRQQQVVGLAFAESGRVLQITDREWRRRRCHEQLLAVVLIVVLLIVVIVGKLAADAQCHEATRGQEQLAIILARVLFVVFVVRRRVVFNWRRHTESASKRASEQANE